MNGLLQRSITDHLPVDIIYLSAAQKLSQRTLLIKEIDGSTVRAYCLLRKEMRTFRLENILSAMPKKQDEYPLH
ncbi:MAG: hypothetical protein Q8906_08280 [Bacillota bacterium]|nr:hypothetical protein [Bacillota bacterium]MDP4170594.1 hypothetical protein [Bacillota bacterium]